MNIETTCRMYLDVNGIEINAMRKIALLAKKQIEESPVIPMHGCPLHRQAGMFGNDLNATIDMIDQILSETEYLNAF